MSVSPKLAAVTTQALAQDEVVMIQFAVSNLCSLAEAQQNQLVRVERILYRTLRDLLAGIGLNEGDELLCRGSYRSHVILQAETGRRVIVNQEWARFIRVRVCDG